MGLSIAIYPYAYLVKIYRTIHHHLGCLGRLGFYRDINLLAAVEKQENQTH
jgi:hypothetical protein